MIGGGGASRDAQEDRRKGPTAAREKENRKEVERNKRTRSTRWKERERARPTQVSKVTSRPPIGAGTCSGSFGPVDSVSYIHLLHQGYGRRGEKSCQLDIYVGIIIIIIKIKKGKTFGLNQVASHLSRAARHEEIFIKMHTPSNQDTPERFPPFSIGNRISRRQRSPLSTLTTTIFGGFEGFGGDQIRIFFFNDRKEKFE